MDARNILIALAIEHNGDYKSIYNAIVNRQNEDLINKYVDFDFNKVNCITLFDEDYPDVLKGIYQPPFVLFYFGNKGLLNSKKDKIAIMGTLNPADNFAQFTKDFVKNLPNDKIIVTGLSKGIQEIAAQSALGRDQIVVLPCGINLIGDDLSHDILRYDCLFVSEYPSRTEKTKDSCMFRNRIIAGLADKVCAITLSEHSGSLMTITQALTYGKEIYCVPDLYNKTAVTNRLIDEGANCLTLATTF